MKALKYEHQSTFPLWGRVKLNFRDRYRKPNIYSKNSSHYQVFHQILKNCHFGVKRKSFLTHMDLYDPYMVPYTIPYWYYNFPKSTNKIQFFDEISTSGKKIVDLMKDLKYEHQSIFPLLGRVKLNFRDRYGKPNIYSKNSSCYQVFHQILKNCHFGVKRKSFLTHMDLYDPYMVPYTIPYWYYNFPKSTNKIQFFDEISTSGKKIVDLMKDLKYEHQSIFPLLGRVKLNFRDRYGKPNIYSKNSSHCKVFLQDCQKMTLA